MLNVSSDEAHNGNQELFEELMVQKPRLLKLVDVGPRSAQEQKEVESGMPEYSVAVVYILTMSRKNHSKRETDGRQL